MKKFKNKNLAYRAAVLLVGVITFSACSSDVEVVNVNPSFDGKSVKTQFAISIPAGGQSKTRVSQDVAQGQVTPVFRGMSNIRLIPFSATNDVTFENESLY